MFEKKFTLQNKTKKAS